MTCYISQTESREPSQRGESSHQSRLRCGTASRLLEFRSKVGFGGILSCVSDREQARDGLIGDGKALTSSQGTVAKGSKGKIASSDSTSLGKWEAALAGFDAFGVKIPRE